MSVMLMTCVTEVGIGAGKLAVHSSFSVEHVKSNKAIRGAVMKMNVSMD